MCLFLVRKILLQAVFGFLSLIGGLDCFVAPELKSLKALGVK
jgi:hypothetical protein